MFRCLGRDKTFYFVLTSDCMLDMRLKGMVLAFVLPQFSITKPDIGWPGGRKGIWVSAHWEKARGRAVCASRQ